MTSSESLPWRKSVNSGLPNDAIGQEVIVIVLNMTQVTEGLPCKGKNKISAKFLGKGNQIILSFSSFSLSLSFSILRRELLLIYPMIIKRSTSVQRHLWVLTSNPRPLGPWPWSQHPAGWPDQSWPQWCPPAIPYFHILSRLRGQNPFQPVWDNLGVSCFNFHKMQTKMDTDSQIVLSTGLIRFLAFPNQHLQISSISSTLFYTLRRKIWTYMRYVWISLNISLLFARGTRPPWWIWHLWRMVPSTTMEYPASGGSCHLHWPQSIQNPTTRGANNFRFYTSKPKLPIGSMEA